MDLRFWDDPETGQPHIYGHDVTEQEVHEVMARRGVDYPEGKMLAFGWAKRQRVAT